MFSPTFAIRPLPLLLSGIAALGYCLGCCGVAFAEDDNESGPYVGAGYGQFDLEIDDINGLTDAISNLDSDDGAWRAFFGWRFNRWFSLEADYVDLGTPRGNFDAAGTSGEYKVELSGFSGYAIGTLPLGIFELLGKIGYYFHDVKIDVNLENIGPGNGDVIGTDDNGEALVYGVGVGLTLIDHLNARVEYERMEIDELKDAYVLWLTGAWRF